MIAWARRANRPSPRVWLIASLRYLLALVVTLAWAILVVSVGGWWFTRHNLIALATIASVSAKVSVEDRPRNQTAMSNAAAW